MSVQEAAARLEELHPGYLERARKLARGMGVHSTPADRLEPALDMVEETAAVNADVPILSRHRHTLILKRLVARLARFYFVYLCDQVTELGGSVSWLGRALGDYLAALEAEVETLRAEVGRLEARVDRLERTG